VNRQLKEAIDKWDSEVSGETARLIERGVPPFDAVECAVKNVSTRRSSKAFEADTVSPRKSRP
jgi:hypothetical protein